MSPLDRPASTAWEQFPLRELPDRFVWVWFKPSAAPQSVLLQLPQQADPPHQPPLTLRALAMSIGVDPRIVGSVTIAGVTYDARQNAGPLWDSPLPRPRAGVDPTIALTLLAASGAAPGEAAAGAAAVPAALPATTAVGGRDEILARIEACWNACLQLELQLTSAAKQLNGSLTKLNALNRDLSSEESRYGDNQDKREWGDARRWLRDGAARLSRYLKDHHVGMTSAAGKRNTFETIYKQYAVPGRPFEGMEQMEREFEIYRKTLQTLLNNMNSALGAAVQDGERRAQLILGRIAAKARAARSKR